MTEVNKGKVSDAADLIKKGATLLGEPCPKCGSLQVRYKNRTLCLSCDDLSDLSAIKSMIRINGIPKNLRVLVLSKLRQLYYSLKEEENIDKQAKIADLILLYLEIIERLGKPR
ncbi:MAG: autoantigen p27 domain-containing protein [Candidatus Methylarchaceae archaeon HK02M2]|nr:autoantigen p27 domain-containing protein [Candidatus Methylarchaceae archaeon HK02M2]